MRVLCLLLALSGVSAAADPEFRVRREALAKASPDGVIVLFGRAEKDNEDLRSGFYQESNFFYLTGWKEPDATLLIEPGKDGIAREILFLPRHDPEREKWTGIGAASGDPRVSEITGFEKVEPRESFEAELRASLERLPRIYTAGEAATSALKAAAPLREVSSVTLAIARLRMKKSPHEIGLIQRSIDATIAAHLAAWKRVAPGQYEYQIASTMLSVYLDRGCERSAYTPIVGSGPDSVFLHYSRNSRRMDGGDVLLMDVGAECAGYAADITRTVPVGGKFSPRQRELYQVVLGAQKAAVAAVKPGMTFSRNQPHSLYQIAYDYINTHGKDLHGEPLGKYFTHGLSHHVGLDVHDAWDPALPLQEGMVITIEPGVYIPEENIGIRIEDMVLVTAEGAKVLSAALPREIPDIEKAIAK
jgi:Xaa-Pro aminopeptidase